MRETRLYDYTDASTSPSSFRNADIAVPIFTRPSTFIDGSWSSLLSDSLIWRVESGSSLIFESLETRNALSINFTSPLTCRPFFTTTITTDRNTVSFLVSLHTNRTSSLLILLRINQNLTPHSVDSPYEEVARLALQGTYITSFAKLQHHVVVGLTDGRCAVLNAAPSTGLSLKPFAPLPSRSHYRREPAESTSIISAASSDSVQSHRSSASSMSLALMSRLFRTPRHEARAPFSENTSMEHSHAALSGHIRESFRAKAGAVDGIIALAAVGADSNAVMSLHRSGRACMFIAVGDEFHFAADTCIPLKLSSANVNHFLLPASSSSVVAVVMVDEDPSADSLRIYNLAVRSVENTATIACSQIAKRDGPVDRIVAAVFTGEDVIVGTDSGSLSGLLNLSPETDAAIGVPSGSIWTAMDDLDQSYGTGPILDEALPAERTPCLSAYRFSAYAVAKALRYPNPSTYARGNLQQLIASHEFADHDENNWYRVKTRATQISKLEGMAVRDVTLVEGVGIAVARENSLYVLRALTEPERAIYEKTSQLVNDRVAKASGRVAALLSAHGTCQTLTALYKKSFGDEEQRNDLALMLNVWTRFSGKQVDRPLGDVVVESAIADAEAADLPANSTSAIESTLLALKPGPELLKRLLACGEVETLSVVSESCGNILPVSAMFAAGISKLAIYRQQSVDPTLDMDEFRSGDALMLEDNRLTHMLDQAFSFLIQASDWCGDIQERGRLRTDKEKDEDARCAMSLAGLSKTVDLSGIDTGMALQEASATLSSSSHLVNGVDGQSELKNLGFWLLERSVRLLERSGAAQMAAAAAMRAMAKAPDRKRYEAMRAAAFSRFIDAGELENGLTALLYAPYRDGDESPEVSDAESSALRDAVVTLVNTTADKGKLQWLAESNLPEPLRVLCSQALERRARAADSFRVPTHILRKPSERMPLDDQMDSDNIEEDSPSEYELLYAWHIMRGDEGSAATAALEWAERLRDEGLGLLRAVVGGKPPIISKETQTKMLQVWTRARCTALSYCSAAARLQPEDSCYIARSRFSILSREGFPNNDGVVDVDWVSRRHLLAHTQGMCLKKILSEHERGRDHGVECLFSPGSVFLAENEEGLRYAVSQLAQSPSLGNFSVCANLCAAWCDELGDKPLIELIRAAAACSARNDVESFDYSDLDELLTEVRSLRPKPGTARNWAMIAFQSALSETGGVAACPQWLVDEAAWGDAAVGGGKCKFSGVGCGDAPGVIRAYLLNDRPIDAAMIIIRGLKDVTDGKEDNVYVPYAAIDATLDLLERTQQHYDGAIPCIGKLRKWVEKHIETVSGALSKAAADGLPGGMVDSVVREGMEIGS